MIDYPMVLLSGCGVALASVVGYAFWVKIRVLRLQVDMIEIFLDFRDAARREGVSGDPEVRQYARDIRRSIFRANRVSLPSFLYFLLKKEASRINADVEPIRSDDPRIVNLIRMFRIRFSMRIANYLFYETFCGWMILPILKAIPKLSKDENHRVAERWYARYEEMQTV